MKFGVVVFPGSNCDKESNCVPEQISDQQVVKHWHIDGPVIIGSILRTLHV